jgi:hypothetical protein
MASEARHRGRATGNGRPRRTEIGHVERRNTAGAADPTMNITMSTLMT